MAPNTPDYQALTTSTQRLWACHPASVSPPHPLVLSLTVTGILHGMALVGTSGHLSLPVLALKPTQALGLRAPVESLGGAQAFRAHSQQRKHQVRAGRPARSTAETHRRPGPNSGGVGKALESLVPPTIPSPLTQQPMEPRARDGDPWTSPRDKSDQNHNHLRQDQKGRGHHTPTYMSVLYYGEGTKMTQI